ncbi:MEMO1-like protein [Babesia divergens]|uniref:MEMO1-like protein n=1 Tax=Babesia divergens TaxID=32595 RepID=A0AAD9LKH8_BABDI|nr:MEMO1-like protein [Babesia divergens]
MRKDTHADSWYTNDGMSSYFNANYTLRMAPTLLQAEIQKALDKSTEVPKENLKYIISPHAGYAYSLKTAAISYSVIDASKIKTIFILGPSHFTSLRGCGVDTFTRLKTPLGSLHVDKDIIADLKSQSGFVKISGADSEMEHSIEMQLPILKHILEKLASPLSSGPWTATTSIKPVPNSLLPYFQKEDTIFVISSDFCHFGRRFGFTHTGYEHTTMGLSEAIQRLDLDGVKHIVKNDLIGFKQYLEDTRNTICGRHPIEVLLKLINLSGIQIRSKLLSYTQVRDSVVHCQFVQSSQCRSTQDSSVSYCAIAGLWIEG